MTHISFDPALTPSGAAAPRHDGVTQAIHWLSLLAIAAAFIAGLVMEEMPRGAAKAQLVNFHASMGVAVVVLTVVRLSWRTVAAAPEPLPGSPLMRLAAKAMAGALYVMLVAIPLSGVAMMAVKGRTFEVFGLFTMPALASPDRELGSLLEEAHEVLANLTLALVGLHAAAALLHQFVLRDGGLARMLPSGRRA